MSRTTPWVLVLCAMAAGCQNRQTEEGSTPPRAPPSAGFAPAWFDCSHRVTWSLGPSTLRPGDRVEIQRVTGSSSRIDVGTTLCVEGEYTLSSEEEAQLSFSVTSTNRTRRKPSTWVSSHVWVERGAGSFQLVARVGDLGNPHLTFYTERDPIGGVQFGDRGTLRPW